MRSLLTVLCQGWLTNKIKVKVTDALSFGGGDTLGQSEEAIDEKLSPLERVSRYSESSVISHRLYVVRELVDLAREAGSEASCREIVPALEKLVRDVEPTVRQGLVENLPDFCRFLMDHITQEQYVTNILHILIPLVAELTTDDNPQTRAAAVTALVQVAKIVKHEDLVPYLMPIMRSLAKDRTEEEHRVQAAILLHSLADTMGRDVCLEHVVPKVEVLAKDPQFRVRKAVASHVGLLVPVVGEGKGLEVLLSVFLGLAEDEIWGVRKACCDSLVAVSLALAPDVRSARLVPLFEKLADDQSRWVRNAAFQSLGPFIATFSDGRIDPKLLMFFRTMPHPSKHGRDGDIALYCAHSFPAVLLTLGGARWGELSDLYLLLVKDLQWKVRKTLAHSLHEVGALVGQQVAERTLLTIFEAFLQDLEEVKVGVVMNLGGFLAVLSPECRSQYAHVIRDIREDMSNWRFREMIAQQMAVFVKLFVGQELVDIIIPALLGLCKDPVLTVRHASVSGAAMLLSVLSENPALNDVMDKVSRQIFAFSEGSFQDRKTFAKICGEFLGLPNANPTERLVFRGHLEALAADKIPNVRLIVAQLLVKHVPESSALVALRSDPDYDVRFSATQEWIPFSARNRKHGEDHVVGAGAVATVIPANLPRGPVLLERADSTNLIPQLSALNFKDEN